MTKLSLFSSLLLFDPKCHLKSENCHKLPDQYVILEPFSLKSFQDKVVSINLHLLYRPRRQRCLITESKLQASFETWFIIGIYLVIGTREFFWKTTGLPELGIWNTLWLDRCCWNYSFLTVWKKLRNLSLCKKVFLWLWKSLF